MPPAYRLRTSTKRTTGVARDDSPGEAIVSSPSQPSATGQGRAMTRGEIASVEKRSREIVGDKWAQVVQALAHANEA